MGKQEPQECAEIQELPSLPPLQDTRRRMPVWLWSLECVLALTFPAPACLQLQMRGATTKYQQAEGVEKKCKTGMLITQPQRQI